MPPVFSPKFNKIQPKNLKNFATFGGNLEASILISVSRLASITKNPNEVLTDPTEQEVTTKKGWHKGVQFNSKAQFSRKS